MGASVRRRERLRFEGRITGFGTAAGERFVLGWWDRSPLGAFVDVMHEGADGHRRLLAPSQDVADFVTATYRFDEVVVVPCSAAWDGRTVRLAAGDLEAAISIGARTALGWVLSAVPVRLATAPGWCAAIDPIARVVLPGVRTRGSAGGGRREWYGATSHRRVDHLRATLGGRDLGALADLTPPVTFGFGSAPRRPAMVEVTTTIELPPA